MYKHTTKATGYIFLKGLLAVTMATHLRKAWPLLILSHVALAVAPNPAEDVLHVQSSGAGEASVSVMSDVIVQRFRNLNFTSLSVCCTLGASEVSKSSHQCQGDKLNGTMKFQFVNLTGNTNYTISATLRDEYNNLLTFHRGLQMERGRPPRPLAVIVDNITTTGAWVHWQVRHLDASNSHYNMTLYRNGGMVQEMYLNHTDSYHISSLSETTFYTLQLVVVNEFGHSNPVSVTFRTEASSRYTGFPLLIIIWAVCLFLLLAVAGFCCLAFWFIRRRRRRKAEETVKMLDDEKASEPYSPNGLAHLTSIHPTPTLQGQRRFYSNLDGDAAEASPNYEVEMYPSGSLERRQSSKQANVYVAMQRQNRNPSLSSSVSRDPPVMRDPQGSRVSYYDPSDLEQQTTLERRSVRVPVLPIEKRQGSRIYANAVSGSLRTSRLDSNVSDYADTYHFATSRC